MRIYAPAPQQRSQSREFWQSSFLPYFLLISLLVLIGVSFGIGVTEWGTRLSQKYGYGFYCLPNGGMSYPWMNQYNNYYSTWDYKQSLSITLAFGAFNFSTAKAIDISWDLLIGRGGQALLSWICYPLFRRALIRAMETKEVTFSTFSAMAFENVSLNTVSALCLPPCTRTEDSVVDRRGWRSVLLGLAFAYLVAFPTFMSSVTGYQSGMSGYINNTDGRLLPTMNWKIPIFIIKDGSRIGLADNFLLGNWNDRSSNSTYAGFDLTGLPGSDVQTLLTIMDECYVSAEYYFSRPTNVSSQGNFTFYPPRGLGCFYTLPASATALNQSLTSTIIIGNISHVIDAPPLQVQYSEFVSNDTALFSISDVWLNRTYMIANSFCEPAKTYQWGFSSIPLFVFTLLTLGFTIVLTILQRRTFNHGRVERYADVAEMNTYRDVLDLAEELKSQLGEEVQHMPAKELKRLVKWRPGEVRIDVDDLGPSRIEEKKSAKMRLKTSHATRSARFFSRLPGRRRSTAASKSSIAEQALITDEDVELQTQRPK